MAIGYTPRQPSPTEVACSTNAASSSVQLSSARLPPAVPTEVLMRRIGLAVVLALGLFAARENRRGSESANKGPSWARSRRETSTRRTDRADLGRSATGIRDIDHLHSDE